MNKITNLHGRKFERPTLRRERSSDYNLFDPNFKIDVLNWCTRRASLLDKSEILTNMYISMNNHVNELQIVNNDCGYEHYFSNMKQEMFNLNSRITYFLDTIEGKKIIPSDLLDKWDAKITNIHQDNFNENITLPSHVPSKYENQEKEDEDMEELSCKRKCLTDILQMTMEEQKSISICQDLFCSFVKNLDENGYSFTECDHIIFKNKIIMKCNMECEVYELTQNGSMMFNECVSNLENKMNIV